MNLVRDPFYPNRSVTMQVPQNPLRPFWSGSGYAPVAPRIQQSAGPGLGIVSPTDNVFYSKGGPARMDGHVEMRTRPSGSVLRAGRYLGAVAQRVGPSNEGQVLRTLAAHRAVGFNGLGATATQVACTSAGVATTAYGAGTASGINFSDRDVRAGVGAGVAIIGALAATYCPRPGAAPAPAAAPPPAYGSADMATLLLIAQQQAAADRAAAQRSDEAKALRDAASASNTKYLVVGGVAAVGLIAAVLLLR